MTAMKSPSSRFNRIIVAAPKPAIKTVPQASRNYGDNRIILPARASNTPHDSRTGKVETASRLHSTQTTQKPIYLRKHQSRLKMATKSRALRKVEPLSKRFAQFSIPKKNFQTAVRDIAVDCLPGCKFQSEALYALQVACEDFLTGFFQDANLCTLHAKRKTLMAKDMDLVRRLRGIDYVPL